jgi:hypothetical protein
VKEPGGDGFSHANAAGQTEELHPFNDNAGFFLRDENLTGRADSQQSAPDKSFPGSTGGLPDGMAATLRANRDGLFAKRLFAIPAGGPPTGPGESRPRHPFMARVGRGRSASTHRSW